MEHHFNVLAAVRAARHGSLSWLGPAWRLLGKAYRLLLRLPGVQFSVQTCIGHYGPYHLDGRFAFSNFSNWGTGRNAAFTACVERCRGKKCILDIGAHVGLVSLPVGDMIDPNGVVIAFEPAAINRRLLHRHISLNKVSSIIVVDAVVGEDDREAVDFWEKATDTGINSVVGRKGSRGFSRTSPRQIALDTYCEQKNLRPDVIKVDVEGAEIGVLKGGARTIMRYMPFIYLSVHPEEILHLGGSTDQLLQLIRKFGYRCTNANGREVINLEDKEYILCPERGRQ